MNTGINENNLRELAYRIWEKEGRPIGQADRHWRMAMEQANLEQDTYTTGTYASGDDLSSGNSFASGDNFLGEKITPEDEAAILQDDRHYQMQNNPLSDESGQADYEAGELEVQQSVERQKPGKTKKRKSSAKIEDSETFATQDISEPRRARSGRRKSSDNNILV